MTQEQLDECKNRVKAAILQFKEADWDTDLKFVDIYEPTISHRIAVYLEKSFYKHHVDCEYNKNGRDPKRDPNGNKIRPDIIVHIRRSSENLIVFEVKKVGHTNKLAKADIDKLRNFLSGNFSYPLCVFIGVLKTRIDVVWITGNEQNTDIVERLTDNVWAIVN